MHTKHSYGKVKDSSDAFTVFTHTHNNIAIIGRQCVHVYRYNYFVLRFLTHVGDKYSSIL